MTAARFNGDNGQLTTLLPNGEVLIAGGVGSSYGTTGGAGPPSNNGLNSAELYNPQTGTWAPTGNMTTLRELHTVTLLPNGKVLVAGGFNNASGTLKSAELYTP